MCHQRHHTLWACASPNNCSREQMSVSLSFCSRLTQSASQSTQTSSIKYINMTHTPPSSIMGSSSLTCIFVSCIALSPGFPTAKLLRVCGVVHFVLTPHHLTQRARAHTPHPFITFSCLREAQGATRDDAPVFSSILKTVCSCITVTKTPNSKLAQNW